MKDWTDSQTLLRTYALTKWVGRYWIEISCTAAIFSVGFYFGTLAGQFA